MSNYKGLILAAGRGSRLGSSSRQLPKCLLEVGRKRLIEHQLEALADAGIGPVVMVLGYCAEEIREVVGIRAEYVSNSRWESTNSLYSFALARDAIDGPVIILNSDVLFSPEILEKLLDAEGDAIAIDSESGDAREQMKVKTIDGCVAGMSKSMPAAEAAGENLGILKLSAETANLLFDHADRIIQAGGEKDWLGAAFQEVAKVRRIRAVDVAGLPWVEIDFPVDLRAARKEVWPAIEARRRRKSRWGRRLLVAVAASLLIGAFGIGQMLSPPSREASSEWETIPFEVLQPERITLGGQQQSWWLLEDGQVGEIDVVGPARIRLESRLLDFPGEREPYVLEVKIGDELLDWFQHKTRPSGKAEHPRWMVSHKKRIRLDIPAGAQRLKVRLVAPRGAQCLVRVRQYEDESDE